MTDTVLWLNEFLHTIRNSFSHNATCHSDNSPSETGTEKVLSVRALTLVFLYSFIILSHISAGCLFSRVLVDCRPWVCVCVCVHPHLKMKSWRGKQRDLKKRHVWEDKGIGVSGSKTRDFQKRFWETQFFWGRVSPHHLVAPQSSQGDGAIRLPPWDVIMY